jgi:hypothetical protein
MKAALLLLAAQFGSLFADNILEMRRLAALRGRAAREVRALREQNRRLVAKAHALQNDPYFVELTLRRKLRWMRPEEIQPFTPAGIRLCKAHSKLRKAAPTDHAQGSLRNRDIALAEHHRHEHR